ncbi:MAG: hypothetical protein E7629_06255 [Ruminococcaceae bacterium]|nr:hypothetical protein [Oscillospiraceae bacterium]
MAVRITNITELVWGRDLEALLRMCGEKECFIDDSASDYQRFCSLCRSAHLLPGNRLAYRASKILETLLEHPVDLCEENAESLWIESAERLLVTNVSPTYGDRFSALEADEKCLDICPRCALSDFWNGNSFLNTSRSAWEPWRDEMEARWEDAFQKELFGVSLTLPRGFVFQSPNPYAVDTALRKRESEADRNLLLAQVFRFLSEKCFKSKKILLCRVECDAKEAVRLLSYAEAKVGLSRLILCLVPSCDHPTLTSFCGVPHLNAVECALQRCDYPTDADFLAALRRCADLYPLGNLMILE